MGLVTETFCTFKMKKILYTILKKKLGVSLLTVIDGGKPPPLSLILIQCCGSTVDPKDPYPFAGSGSKILSTNSDLDLNLANFPHPSSLVPNS